MRPYHSSTFNQTHHSSKGDLPMKQITLFFTIIMACSITHAAIITVDNKTPSVGQYKTLQEAHDAANDGDTLYVCPSETVYEAFTVDKKLSIFGTGHSRPGERMSTTTINGNISFNEGSDGASLKGFSGYFTIVINANDIIIKKNRIRRITVNENHKGTVILQNYVYEFSDQYLATIKSNNEVFISNNIFINKRDCGKSISAQFKDISITVINNIFINHVRDSRSNSLYILNANIFVANNIFISGNIQKTSDNFYNNMSNSTQLPSGNGNLTNIDMSKVFIDPTKDFHLLEDSPAKGAGIDGVDMGIYGGSTPYVDDGKPSLPSIIKLKTDHSASQAHGLEIEIQAISNTE